MINFVRMMCACGVLAAAFASGSTPTWAITAELAKKCRDLALKAAPPQPAGGKAYAAAERKYYEECVAKGGNVADNGANPKK